MFRNRTIATQSLSCGIFALAIIWGKGGGLEPDLRAAQNSGKGGKVSIKVVNYNGWRNTYLLTNGIAEVVVAPSIGRIMQFRLSGEDGVFWENQAMIGRKLNPKSADWANFGGDKSWPAPQGSWGEITPRAWPPPVAFDSLPLEAAEKEGVLELTSPVDPHYGIRVIRRIQLSPDAPVLTVTTRFAKLEAKPVKTSIWVITQCKNPVGVYLRLPAKSIFAEGYNRQSEGLPSNLKVSNRILSLTRGSETNEKIGSDSGTLVWVGARQVLKIESPRIPNQEYPDNGSSTEVYTNADPLPYVELEVLGPLRQLKPGDHLEQTSTYTLRLRSSKDPLADARKILGLDR